jgi:histidinol-phosphatase (PHP family)
MLDYHLHLWPHETPDTWLSIDQLADYCEQAKREGVEELAITEHLYRFHQATDIVGRFWEQTEDDPRLQAEVASFFDHHGRSDLDAYVELAMEAKRQGLPVKIGMEVDYYRGQMDLVADLLADYPFDVLLGSVHWVGGWLFDDIDNAVQLAQWEARKVDDCWDAYTTALEELAATASCDVLAHPDLIKVAGQIPENPTEWWDRIAEAAASSGMSAELSSAGWRKPVGEQYPAVPLLERFVAAGVPMTTASDAHELGRVAERAGDLRSLLDVHGIEHLASYEGRQRRMVGLDGA